MKLEKYFETTTGTGILSTADSKGKVDTAIYSRPHFIEGDKLVFIMRDRLTHSNLLSNPHAAYLFLEKGSGYNGKRLYLKMLCEEKNAEQILQLQRRNYEAEVTEDRFLVFFELEKELPLIGGEG